MKSTLKMALVLILINWPTIGRSQHIAYGKNAEVGKTVNINGIDLYYEAYGEGKPLLMLHGNGGYGGSRANILPELISEYRVILVDHRCHGQSGCSDELNYTLMADDIKGLLDHLKINSTLIYGHSDGGIIGLILASSYPDRVSKLVVSGANIKRDSTGLEPFIVDVMGNYQTIQDEQMRKQIKLMHEYPNLDFAQLKDITAPTLIISGDRDAVRLSHTIKIFESIPNANLSVLPATTHFVGEERPKVLLGMIHNFFSSPFQMPSTIAWAKAVAEQIMPGWEKKKK